MANDRKPDILVNVADYYSAKLAEHGVQARGVDWNGEESQRLRFKQLTGIIVDGPRFSVNDLGCGYGACFDYLSERHSGFDYFGWDVSAAMIDAARARHGHFANAHYDVASEPAITADYGMASGIFNVRLGHDASEWKAYIERTLDSLNRTSRLGFAFNCLTSYSDQDRMRSDLHYVDPCEMFDYCKRKYARNVALLHDYELYEFTILVRKVS